MAVAKELRKKRRLEYEDVISIIRRQTGGDERPIVFQHDKFPGDAQSIPSGNSHINGWVTRAVEGRRVSPEKLAKWKEEKQRSRSRRGQ